MAQSFSKTMFIGNLGADPEVRYTAGGNPIAKFSAATTETWRDKATGQPQERTEWHRVVIFGALAELVGKFCSKGSKVFVEGRNQTREWEKDGIKRTITEIIVDQRGMVQFLDSRPVAATQNTHTPAPQAAEQPQQSSSSMPDYPPYDEDIPYSPAHFLIGV